MLDKEGKDLMAEIEAEEEDNCKNVTVAENLGTSEDLALKLHTIQSNN